MNSALIEQISISCVQDEIFKNEYLKPNLATNDKTPCFDGSITLYRSHSHSNGDILGNVPVQVKGKKVDIIKNDSITYPIRIPDLKNYLNEGGVLFFVVHLITRDNYRVFYNLLLPTDIELLLSVAKKSTKSIELTRLNQTVLSLLDICKHFLTNRMMQYSTIDYAIKSPTEINKIIFNYPSNNLSVIQNLQAYLYAQNDETTPPIPLIGTFHYFQINQSDRTIRVKDVTYFSGCEVRKSKDLLIVHVIDGLEFNFKTKKLHITATGTLDERIKKLEFLVAIIKHKSFCIGDLEIPIPLTKRINLCEWEDLLFKHLHIRDLLILLKITKQLHLDSMTPTDISRLSFLVDGLVLQQIVYQTKLQNQFLKVRVANICVLIFCEQIEHNGIKIYNIFDPKFIVNHPIQVTDTNSNTYTANIFCALSVDALSNIDNVDFDIILSTLKQTPVSPSYIDHVILFTLELIKSFDITNNIKFSDITLAIYDWLDEVVDYKPDAITIIINKLQVLRRFRELDSAEIDSLYKIKESISADNYIVLTALSVLLESRLDFNKYLNKLDDENLKVFMNYPLYTLATKLNLVHA